MPSSADVVVVGAGLAGLTSARDIHRSGLSVQVLEARQRVGGRILTVSAEGLAKGQPAFDLGATWHWSDQPEIRALADDLGLTSFGQYEGGQHLAEDIIGIPPVATDLVPVPAETLRFAGGAQQLCERLAGQLPDSSVTFGATVVGIIDSGEHLEVVAEDSSRQQTRTAATSVIVAMPPRLILERITFSPPLADGVTRAMNLTPTWMADVIKCVAVYESPFWRAAGRSGTVFSTLGPLREIHDASPEDGDAGALWGFFSADDRYREMGPAERAQAVFPQLERLFGPEAGDPVQYFERDWSSDPFTKDEIFWIDEAPLDYGEPLFSQPLFNDRLFFAGTETVAGGGHMEGAVRSGQRAAQQVMQARRA